MVQEHGGHKRKYSHSEVQEDDLDVDLNLNLNLSLSLSSSSSSSDLPSIAPPPTLLPNPFYVSFPPLPPPPPPTSSQIQYPTNPRPSIVHNPKKRAGARKLRSPKSSEATMENPPFLWATNRQATIHTLEYLRANNLTKITGDLQCKKCNATYSHEFDLNVKFNEVAEFIIQNKEDMRERAPKRWTHPSVPVCAKCGENDGVKPVIPEDRKEINWLFLLLGEMIGFCTLDNLKYFCEFTKNHRTGAKDRVLFLTYLALCKQLDPSGPFDR